MRNFATLKAVTGIAGDDVGASLRAIGERLAETEERGNALVRVISDGGSDRVWTVELGPKGVRVHDGALDKTKPSLEIVTRGETWSKIVSGSLSPVEAFVTGKLRVRGDTELGKRVVRHLSGNEGEVDVCKC